jgi:hypothetical protein
MATYLSSSDRTQTDGRAKTDARTPTPRRAPRRGRPGSAGRPGGRARTSWAWRWSWTGPLAIVLVLIGLFGTGAGLGQATADQWRSWFAGSSKPPPKKFPVLDSSRPIRIAISSINVQAPVFNVGLAADGSIAVPPLQRHNEAGWYDGSPTPGQVGPAIIVGHADTRTGPSIFHDLIKLQPGATVEVTRQDRAVATFEVNSVEHFDKAKLPAQRVYGDFSRPGLRLITCGGQWIGGSIGYADNVVVFASLVKARQP